MVPVTEIKSKGDIVMLLIIIAALLLVASPAQAQQACTEMGCMNGLTIDVPLDYRWQPGAYVFDFNLDGKAVRCTGSLPLKSCDQPSITCSAEGVMIMESGCALPKNGHGFGMITIDSSPASASIKITRSGQMIAQNSWKPAYQITRPNGPRCEPTCRQATVSLTLK
jgi:hypothetical protein